MTGYTGMRAIGQPAANDTVVISAPMGAVGAVAADVARQSGARTVGITSGPEKCRQLVESLGFDAAVARRDPAFAQLLARACPRGIDVYFENAGGPIWDAVLPLLRFFGRVPVSGLVADYAPDAAGGGPDRLQVAMKKIQTHRITVRGLAVFDHAELEEEFTENTAARIQTGKLRYLEHTFEGLEHAPEALTKVLTGRTTGKAVVRVGAE
jgi:NADPH-dependent curcumin reductase CurA